jgi:hypothetical protein
MNPNCENEQLVLAALRTGTLHGELAKHVENCEACQEAMLVALCLKEEIAPDAAKVRLPEAAFVWRRARERSRAQAIERATLPIHYARLAAYGVAVLGTVWFLAAFPAIRSRIFYLGLELFPTFDHFRPAALSGNMMAGIGASFGCIAVSSWYVLRQD